MLTLIIFGTKGVTSVRGSGSFYCPSCETERSYEQKEVRRYFSLYFIPIIPLDRLGEYVECRSCRRTYERAVLDYRPRLGPGRLEAELHAAMKRVMVMMLLAGGAVQAPEIERVRRAYGKLTGEQVSAEDVEREVEAARSDQKDIATWARTMTDRLDESGREMVVRAALCVAAADGELRPAERKALAALATALELPAARFKAILEELAR